MRYVCPLTFILPVTLAAQDGAAIYKERCASCHAAGEGRAPKQDSKLLILMVGPTRRF